MKKSNLILHIIITGLFASELISCWNNYQTFENYTKPCLMIWIAVYFYINTHDLKKSIFIYLAFLFSWIGDLLLMAAHSNEMLFYAGVGGFFLAQLSYIISFLGKSVSGNRGYLFYKPFWIMPFLVYIAIVLSLILGGMNGVMIPIIIVYALSLISMSVTALNRKGLVNKISFILIFCGSILFVISDSMLAINKFYSSIPKASFLIMLTYFAAQYLIMQGLIEER